MHNRNSFPDKNDGQFLLNELENKGQEPDEHDEITVSDVDEELGFVVCVFQVIFPFLFLVFIGITLMYLFFSFW
ncbi:MAG: hypothetical protein HPY81_06900 [Firmicutes bacterium]|nr:hypothetical protein [Bacillota bacterium]